MHAKRTLATTFALAATLTLAACSDGSRNANTPTPQTAAPSPTSDPSPTASPTPPVEQDTFRSGDPITAADATFTIPVEREGRRLQAVGGYHDEILVAAEKDVPYLPGEVVGQGAKAYDQVFMLWNPETNTFRRVWANESVRNESVLGIDGDWVLSELYRLNPGNFWILRLRNIVTGEVRDVDRESDQMRGLEYPMSPRIDAGRVIYTRLSGPSGARSSSIVSYDIASATTQTLEEADWDEAAGGILLSQATVDGQRLVWSRQEAGRLSTIVRDLSRGQQQTIADPRLGICFLIPGSSYLACNGAPSISGPSSQGDVERISTYNLDDGSLQPLTTNGGMPWSVWNGWFLTGEILWNSHGMVGRSVDQTLVGGSPRVIEGWFTWVEWKNGADGRRDFAHSTLYVMRLN